MNRILGNEKEKPFFFVSRTLGSNTHQRLVFRQHFAGVAWIDTTRSGSDLVVVVVV
jgi:hypothetical protein